ncbi:MAG: glycosyltransferase [Gorillibacterium sp.]|nr:glycosyltransferase [Gorillibacterium sp.]
MVSGQKHKILILSGDLGDGHIQAAGAIAEAARLYGPGAETVTFNFPAVTHPRFHQIGRYFYTKWVTTFPFVYGYLFQKTRGENTVSQIFKKMKFYTLNRLNRLLQEVQPTVIVATFPGAAAGISMLKENGFTDLPAVTIITDHTDHSYWLHPYTDLYIVASDQVKKALLERGIPDKRISVTGIPIRSQFSKTIDRLQLRDKLGLDPTLPVVLLMGGGMGMIAKECSSMLLSNDILIPTQFVMICGHNDRLRQQLEREMTDSPHSVHVTGFVDNIHEWMAAADLLVTKPGGLTTSEAIAMELPMLLYRSLPGQERDNATFLTQAGVAIAARNEADLVHRLNHLLAHPEELLVLRKNAVACQRKNAAPQALAAILETDVSPQPGELQTALYARA